MKTGVVRGLALAILVVLSFGAVWADAGRDGVRKAQAALRERGYDPGTVDGLMGPSTRSAIRRFQEQEGLPATGRLDRRTQAALGIDVAVPPVRQDVSEERQRAERAAAVLSEILAAPDQQIPGELLERAHAIAVIPHVVKGAFGFGGRYGRGLIARRMEDGHWGAPAYMRIGGGSFGLQLGVSATDLVLVFTDHGSVEGLLKGRLKLGADVSAAAGPVGRSVEAGTDVTLGSAIYSYSRSRGLFAGVALDGAVVQMDDGPNRKVYGREGREILLDQDTAVATTTLPLVERLNEASPERLK